MQNFSSLKLEVFKLMVKNNGVRAFALEGDYGGCEQVNRYIHGGEGTAQEAAAAIGFSIYRTEEMAELISYMRQYNESALEGEDLRFYGFDMQRLSYSMRFLKESCKELEVDTTNLQKLVEGENWSSECDLSTRTETPYTSEERIGKQERFGKCNSLCRYFNAAFRASNSDK